MITRENRTIRLYWAKADLFRTICTDTAYNARALTDDKGRALFDEYTLTDDERSFFDENIPQALHTLLQQFRRIIPDSMPMEIEGDTCGLSFSARLSEDRDELYSRAELEAVEHHAMEVIRNVIVAEWYLSVRANDLWTAHLQKLTAAVSALSTLLFRFFRPALKTAFEVTTEPTEHPDKDYNIHIDAGTI